MTLRQRVISILLIVVTFAILVGSYIAAGFSIQYDIAVGAVCPEDIYATRNIIDNVTTSERRDSAAESVEAVYTTDFGSVDTAVEKVNTAITTIRQDRGFVGYIPESEGDAYTFENTTFLSDELYNSAISLSHSDFELLAEHVPDILRGVMTDGVTNKYKGITAFNTEFDTLTENDSLKKIAYALCQGAIKVNKTLNADETQKQIESARNAVSNVTYMKNQIIARRGEIVTTAQYAMIKDLGLVKGSIQIDLFHTISVVSLLLLVIGLVILYYITIGRRDLSTNMVITTAICSILTVLGAGIILFGIKSGGNWIYIMPISMIPALISLLLSGNLASIVNVITAVLAGIQTNDMSVTLSLIIAGCATSYIFSKVRRRAHLLSATTISAFAYALSYSAIFIDTSKSILDVFIIFAYALLGGFFGGILTIGTIPFWEGIFDVITPMKLGELSNPEHKLLKKLLLNAPGTYHHSLTVANMADAAADAIHANALLARVGAYYHDIGKMENPLNFKENQFGCDNPHDSLPPEESASLIISHVSAGCRMAKEYRLPSAVRDIILQHHGTTTASFFLYKAKEKDPNVDPSIFTYPGPAPYAKEATIIMLADACEAAVRAMREKGAVDAEKVVSDIVSSRIKEGQLSNSSLSFADLEKVKASFVKTLDQYFHKRIIYPQNEVKE